MNPWEGYMQGQQSLGSSLADLAALQRQRSMDQMAAQQGARAGRLADLQYADLQRKSQEEQRRLTDDQQLRDTMSQGSTQYVQRPGLSLAELGAPQGMQPQSPPFESPSPQPTTGPQVGMENKFSRPNADKVLMDHYAKTDPAKYQGMQKLMVDKFKALSEVDPEGAIGWYNKVSGQNLTYQGKKGDYSIVHTPDGTIVAVNTKNPTDSTIIQKGTPKPPPDSGAHNITEIPSRDGKTAQKFQYNPQTQRYDIPVGEAYKVKSQVPSISLTTNSVDPSHQEALDRAVAEKRLDPYKINSRNRQDLARMAHNNPGIDLNGIAAEMGVARNKDVIMKSGIAEMIPGLLKETVNAGKALNYSDAKFVGGMQKWAKGQLNDPKLVEYMTLRNDQLLTLGGVMRNNGMTDMAQRLEEEAAHPTLSPKALEGWLEGQLKSIDPRLSMYRNLTKGNTAIPRSTYNPGDGAKKLLGGSTPRKVGRFTIEVE